MSRGAKVFVTLARVVRNDPAMPEARSSYDSAMAKAILQAHIWLIVSAPVSGRDTADEVAVLS